MKNNFPTVPTARLEQADKRGTAKIRAIDKGTPYDAVGRHQRWLRQLKTGELGRVTDVVMVARVIRDGEIKYEFFNNGISNNEVAHAMASALLKRYTCQ